MSYSINKYRKITYRNQTRYYSMIITMKIIVSKLNSFMQIVNKILIRNTQIIILWLEAIPVINIQEVNQSEHSTMHYPYKIKKTT